MCVKSEARCHLARRNGPFSRALDDAVGPMKRKSASYESLAVAKRQHVLHQPALVVAGDDALNPFAHAKSSSASGLPEFYDGFPSTAHARLDTRVSQGGEDLF